MAFKGKGIPGFVFTFLLAVQTASAQNVLEALPELTQKAVEITGLKDNGRWEAEVVTREQMRIHVQDQMEKFQSQKMLANEEKILKKFGLIAGASRYVDIVGSVLNEQVAGLYDPWRKKLYILKDFPPEHQEPALFHEVVHALQDQEVPLKKILDPALPTDVLRARQAVLEGHAMWAMSEFITQHMFGMSFADASGLSEDDGSMEHMMRNLMVAAINSQPVLAETPVIVQKGLIFPYLEGMWWVQNKTKRGLTSEKMLNDFPASTESILHPDSEDQPIQINFPPSWKNLPGSWELFHQDTLGEFFWSAWAQNFSMPSAAAMAAGWGGDRLLAYERGTDVLLIAMTTWDTEKDAQSFFDAWQKRARRTKDKALLAAKTPEGLRMIRLKDRSVLVMDGPDAGWMDDLHKEIWKETKWSRNP